MRSRREKTLERARERIENRRLKRALKMAEEGLQRAETDSAHLEDDRNRAGRRSIRKRARRLRELGRKALSLPDGNCRDLARELVRESSAFLSLGVWRGRDPDMSLANLRAMLATLEGLWHRIELKRLEPDVEHGRNFNRKQTPVKKRKDALRILMDRAYKELSEKAMPKKPKWEKALDKALEIDNRRPDDKRLIIGCRFDTKEIEWGQKEVTSFHAFQCRWSRICKKNF